MQKARLSKDMSVYREADIAKTQRDKRHGELRDLSMQHKVHIYWDLNDAAIQDQIFVLQIDDYKVMLDSEQLQRYLRWV